MRYANREITIEELNKVAIPVDIANTIVDPKAYADRQRSDEAFTILRREAPLAVAEPDGYAPFWAVTRHADILEVERQSNQYVSGKRPPLIMAREDEQRQAELAAASGMQLRNVINMDGREHFAHRRLAQDYFVPKNLRNLEGRVRELARETVERMRSHGESCDFASDVAMLYPLQVIMEILGVPRADEALMLKLTQELFGTDDPDLRRSGEETDGLNAVEGTHLSLMEMSEYFGAMTEDRRRNPKDDLASVIANGKIDGQPLGLQEAISYYVITATAGHDTTSHTTAEGMWALLENPDQLRKLRDKPELIPTFIEEAIRWATPVKHFMRTAAEDVELSGQKIAKGDWLMLNYPSGNRDETVFADPFRYDIERTPNKHVAFGYGAHVCLGQHLARMEMRILWEELLPQLRHVEFNGTPKRMAANFVSGPKSVPIRFRMN